MCSYSKNIDKMLFSNCALFKRSFTNKGIGFTFNNEVRRNLFKKSLFPNLSMDVFMVNGHSKVSKMKSASTDNALKVWIENNFEEIDRYEESKSHSSKFGRKELKPVHNHVSLHNPIEPANVRSKGFEIPLGHSTIVYITPKARDIDESGKELSEHQRGCRLVKDTHGLKIFKVYTKEACHLECMINQAYERCGCFPWSYLVTKVRIILLKLVPLSY